MSRKKKGENWGESGFEDWGGYMAAKQAKLEEQFHSEAINETKTSEIFQGIAIFVNGYTDPTADELRRLMMKHGGAYHHYLRPKVTTHIIATNLPYSKIMLYRKSQNPTPICKPEWIVDSIKAGRILKFQNYLLYSHCTDVQPKLNYIVKSKKGEENVTLQEDNKAQPNNEASSSTNNIDNKHVTAKSNITDQVTSNPSIPSSSRDARSSKNSGFISEFYSHSRLHHLSTMGTTFKDYVNELRDRNNGEFPGLIKLKELKHIKLNRLSFGSQSSFNNELPDLQEENRTEISQDPIIMHIDMDCFFVSVGLRDKPELKGLPIAVTHAKGNKNPANNSKQALEDEQGSLSEVASCSYEARKAGVRNGMFLGEALKICPNLKPIPYDFEGYKEVSYILYDTVASYTLDIEAVSCDEMYADCTKILDESCLTPMEFATVIRQEIKDKTGCPVSTGFGNNKLLARLATKKAKPNGQFYIQQENVERCIGTFNVQDLPGVGYTTSHKLNNINVKTCTELQAISLSTLQKEFGKKTGEMLYNMCRGIDHSKLNLEYVRKSVSADVNYGIRFDNNEEAIEFLKKLSQEVCNRLKNVNAKGRCITLKLLVRAKEAPKETEKFMGHGLCDCITKSKNLIAPINDVDIITKEVIVLWNQMQKVPEDARGIGIQISRLEVLKNKSRHATLSSFVNKNKQGDAPHRSVETNQDNVAQSLIKATNVMPSTSKSVTSTDKEMFYIPSVINESILAELPEEIRNEILDAKRNEHLTIVPRNEKLDVKVLKVDEKKSEKGIQTKQEQFFKQSKPGIPKSTKVEMPPIHEIDMSVLIELPEDIRNEILNEYSVRKNQNQPNNDNTNENNSATVSTDSRVQQNTRDEENISFSQVDPEFLAALSEDLKRDVQMYCTVKKAECSKTKKDETTRNVQLTKVECTKQSKKIEFNSKTKGNGKNSKTAPSKNKKKGIQAAFKKLNNERESKNVPNNRINGTTKTVISCKETTESVNNQITADEAEAILSHNRTILENNSENQHQDTLIKLVNRLLNLPLEQVKMQIQIWITNSKTVNEVDFLSLATFLSMLPEKKRIEDLHVLLKTMHRCMTKSGNCIWHRTYRKTVKYVQHYMQIEYNSNLMVPSIKCNLLQCNSDVM
ncbi:DNA repair protein REV1 isoform X1 [Osmia bicornis bicornis]|uniref:DNA repair protein REV1 isoform X1 n=3 Tax=Osmia bicornis bicornis TaxID=1437191 RepID=UPI001EAF2345|nr:DNA repair protein REV1 isoform X1 [Osmia bicornis bicornis]